MGLTLNSNTPELFSSFDVSGPHCVIEISLTSLPYKLNVLLGRVYSYPGHNLSFKNCVLLSLSMVDINHV